MLTYSISRYIILVDVIVTTFVKETIYIEKNNANVQHFHYIMMYDVKVAVS